jgi:hypothetical protein
LGLIACGSLVLLLFLGFLRFLLCILGSEGGRGFLDRLVVLVEGLRRDTIHNVGFLETREIFLIHDFHKLQLDSLEFFAELVTAEVDNLVETALLLCVALTDTIVKDQHITLNRADSLILNLHLVPCGLLDTFTKKFKFKGGLFGLLADLLANLLTFLIDILSAFNINDEIITLQFLNIGDFFVFS